MGNNGGNVVSLSLGSSGSSETTMAYYDELYEDRGVLVVSAAGNRGNEQYSYPASYASVMSVAALAQDGTDYAKSGFSQYNDQVEIAAPGSSVLSTIPSNICILFRDINGNSTRCWRCWTPMGVLPRM